MNSCVVREKFFYNCGHHEGPPKQFVSIPDESCPFWAHKSSLILGVFGATGDHSGYFVIVNDYLESIIFPRKTERKWEPLCVEMIGSNPCLSVSEQIAVLPELRAMSFILGHIQVCLGRSGSKSWNNTRMSWGAIAPDHEEF